MNKWKIRTKIEVGFGIIVVLMLLSISIIPALTRTITSSSDNMETFIRNSNGNYWAATGANLQLAINDLNNLSGWVDCGMNNITISTTIKLGTKCELRNVKLFLANNVNKTMIMNYDLTKGNNGIYIHNIFLEGNGGNQPIQNSSYLMYNQPTGIFLIKCNNVTIHDVIVNNTEFGAIFIQQGKNPIIDRVRIFKVGYRFESILTMMDDCYSAVGVFLYNCSDGTISNVLINKTLSAGIVIESTLPSLWAWKTHNILISNCYVSNTSIGYYFEDARNVTMSNCIAEDIYKKNPGYALAYAVSAKIGTTSDLTFIGCKIDNCANGFGVDANNITIDSCNFWRIKRYAIQSASNDVTISNCFMYKPATIGIYLTGKRNIITGNHIFGGCGYGYAIILSSAINTTISNNIITQSALHYPDYAIYESGTANSTYVSADNIITVANSQVTLVGSKSWYMSVTPTNRTICIQNRLGKTWIST